MNTAKFIVSGLIMVLTLSSCDFVRSIVGKPTSAEIEAIRIEKEARDKAVRDSLAAVRAEEERLAAEQAAATKEHQVYDCRYYVIVGSFQNKENADKYTAQLEKRGFKVTSFNFKTGFRAVSVFGSDNVAAAFREMNDLFNVDITPYDIWVYDTSTNLHE